MWHFGGVPKVPQFQQRNLPEASFAVGMRGPQMDTVCILEGMRREGARWDE